MNYPKDICFKAGRHVTQLLVENFNPQLLFHNLQHTINVVRGARKIAKKEKLYKAQKDTVVLAAWFHDTGFIHQYNEHEKASIEIASVWLYQQGVNSEIIDQILACIAATQMPQQPKSILEKVLCDADLMHLAQPEYFHVQRLLLEEWKIMLGREYTPQEWISENIKFMGEHRYWTVYGRNYLEDLKEQNIKMFRKLNLKE